MATINPSNLYSGGNVNLDSTPFVKFALAQEAKKAAKDEALDKYFAEKNGKLTSTGMRLQEVPALAALKQQITDYGIKNKKSIHDLKDGGKAWGEYNNMWNMAQSVIDNSKALNGVSDLAGKIRINHPELADRFDENTVKGLADHEQAAYIVQGNKVVDNPLHKTFDINSVQYNPKEWQNEDWQKYDKGVETDFAKKMKPSVAYSPIKGNDYELLETTTKSFEKPTLKEIADKAVSDYNRDKGLAYSFNKQHQLTNTPFDKWEQSHVDDYNKANTIFKDATGKDISNPSELHAAEVLRRMSISEPSIKTVTNEAKKQADRVALKLLDDKLIRNRKPDGTVDINTVGQPLDEINRAYGVTETVKGVPRRVVYVDKTPNTFMNTINPTDDNKNIQPVNPIEILQPNGTYRKGFIVNKNGNYEGFKEDDNGKKIPAILGRDDARANYIDKFANTKVKVGFGNKGVITKPSSSTIPTNTKKYKKYSGKVKGM
tara:strand:+ start:435 stop:1898 length:1464 start_codon:yes stop_codon:yes gene_type:complete